MGAQENKQAAEDAYRAFSSGDAEAAMKDMDDSIEWTVRGDNALTGTYNGKQEVGELWGKFVSKAVQHRSARLHRRRRQGRRPDDGHPRGRVGRGRRRPHLQRRGQADRVRHDRRPDGRQRGLPEVGGQASRAPRSPRGRRGVCCSGGPMPELEVRNLTKRFGRTLAVDDLSFSVEAGLVTGFLGPNGAGKTTTMRALMGLLRPTGGEALVEGRPPVEMREPLSTIGAALEATSFHPSRSGRNHLRALAATAAIPSSRVDEVLEMVELTPLGEAPRLRLLARHAPAPGAGGGAARRAADPDPRRAGERARPPGGALAARPAPGPGGRGPHGAGLQPPAWPRSRRPPTA